jgi:hypothetical protein
VSSFTSPMVSTTYNCRDDSIRERSRSPFKANAKIGWRSAIVDRKHPIRYRRLLSRPGEVSERWHK